MKCHDPNSDFKLEVRVCHGNDRCDEYSPHFDRDGSLCCWIPANAGENLSIHSSLQGPLKLSHMDLILDGVLRNSKAITSSTGKSTTRNEKFFAAFQQDGRYISSCTMRVKDLGGTSGFDKTFPHTVGTIEVRVALAANDDRTHDITRDFGTFDDTTSWRDAKVGIVHSQIAPTHEIELVNQDVLKPSARKNFFYHHLKNDKGRPGDKPWAVFKFFYHSGDAIQGLDMVQNNVYSYKLSASSYDDSETETETETDTDPDTGPNSSKESDSTLTAPAPANAAESGMEEEAADAEEPIMRSSGWPNPDPRAPSRLEGNSAKEARLEQKGC